MLILPSEKRVYGLPLRALSGGDRSLEEALGLRVLGQ